MYDERLTDEETTEGFGEDIYEFMNQNLLNEINNLLVQYDSSRLEEILEYLENEFGNPSAPVVQYSGIILGEMPADIQAEIEKIMREHGLFDEKEKPVEEMPTVQFVVPKSSIFNWFRSMFGFTKRN